ncbi:hypothetical protein QBC40DRAFT_298020 [Triangularia verruculosa]|uniref:BAG domain-containing protein n=1 Tax=Triangularia verruculosa TaxID=2587418 RepID=A0AAN6XG05_9PEZI|nr:hypothetical protein QBC40DRAFT_298020 [Triangularia verruculosa]
MEIGFAGFAVLPIPDQGFKASDGKRQEDNKVQTLQPFPNRDHREKRSILPNLEVLELSCQDNATFVPSLPQATLSSCPASVALIGPAIFSAPVEAFFLEHIEVIVNSAKPKPVRYPRSTFSGPPSIVNVATSQGILASSGAFATNLANNITAVLQKLPPSLQAYLDTTVDRLSGATDFVQSSTGLSPTTLYTIATVVLLGAIPAVAAGSKKNGIMRRYGFSSRPSISPFGSTLGHGGVPNVTDEDFSYITSEDLQDHGVGVPSRSYAPQTQYYDLYSSSAPSQAYLRNRPEDDVMLVKYQGITYPEHFPAYCIGDGKLLVSDVRERVRMIMDLTDRQAKRVKLYYKGRRLRDSDAPVRDYGVKNNSEVLMVLDDSGQASSEDSNEELVVVGRDRHDDRRVIRNGRERTHRYGPPSGSPRISRREGFGERSPRDTASSFASSLDIPVEDGRSYRRAKSRVRTQSPAGSAFSTASAPSIPTPAPPPVGKPGGPIQRLNNIALHFETALLPLCVDFMARAPADAGEREKEHRKISETIMQQVILKLDEVDTSTEDGARARRKELIKYIQDVLKLVDDVKSKGVKG